MVNKICLDQNYDIECLISLQDPRDFANLGWNNRIILHINAGPEVTQAVNIYGDGFEPVTYSIAPNQEQDIEILEQWWSYGGTTEVKFWKGSESPTTLDIAFPDEIDGVGMLNQNESIPTYFQMSGSTKSSEELTEDVKEAQEDIERIDQVVEDLGRNKQNFIDNDVLAPSGNGTVGDLVFFGNEGNHHRRLYRYENDAWIRVNPYIYGATFGNTPAEGDLYIETSRAAIESIQLYEDGDWKIFSGGSGGLHIYSSTEHQVGLWINDNEVYERTYKLNSLPSNGSASYAHGIGGIGLVLYARGMKKSNGVYSDLLNDNKVEVDDTNIILTSSSAQTGTAYITIGYTKPSGGYYPDNQYFSHDTGLVCTAAANMSATKDVVGDCYVGMLVWRTQGYYTGWTPFCLSLSQATAEGMSYHYSWMGNRTGTVTFDGNTWYYSMDAQDMGGAWADDGTSPSSRKFNCGDMASADYTAMLTMVLSSIYD